MGFSLYLSSSSSQQPQQEQILPNTLAKNTSPVKVKSPKEAQESPCHAELTKYQRLSTQEEMPF